MKKVNKKVNLFVFDGDVETDHIHFNGEIYYINDIESIKINEYGFVQSIIIKSGSDMINKSRKEIKLLDIINSLENK